MKTLHVATTVLSAILISGVAMAQNAPDSQDGECPQKGARCFQKQRGPQGGPRGQQAQRGPQQNFRGQRGGERGPHGQRQGPSPERLKEAGATDEQIAQIKKIKEEQELKQVDLKATAEKTQIQMKQLMSSEKPDKDAIFAAVDKASAAKAALMKSGIAARFKAREILGDEVTKKLRELGPSKGKCSRGSAGQRGPRGRAQADAPAPEKADI
ncbi:MAG: periplasmic heavy metal sensor [Kiritimatiellae bacterium]|jgi:Spy/CpxP family protein refolding chaperone|nr:periplasmic heavy metal sensor [Kiritimatiellia bacterium]